MPAEGSVALVTGAGLRLGREIALALAGAGHDVVVHFGSSRQPAEATAASIEALGRRAWTVEGDLADVAAIERIFHEVEVLAGRLDVLVNSAARFDRQALDDVSVEDWERTMAVNLRAPFFCTQQGARMMRRNPGGGVVVNLADHAGVSPWLGYPVHGISKAGIVFLTRSAARELGPEVRVNAIVPGPILPPPGEDAGSEAWRRRGDHLPLGRTGRSEDVNRAVLYLVGAGYVTGVVLPVDGGEHLTPARGR